MTDKLFENQGELIEVGSNKPFLLNEPNSIWFIEAGLVNVFWVLLEKQEPVGIHHHLFKAEAGKALFGISAPQDKGVGFLAVGVSGTRLKKIKRSDIEDLVKIAPLIEGWIYGVSSGISAEAILPKGVTQLEPGKEFNLEEGKSACAKKGTVWLSLSSGTAHFLGKKELVAHWNGTFFPLSSQVWLETDKGVKLTCHSTDEVLKKDLEWRGIDLFHQFVLKQIQIERDEELHDEQNRFKKREESDTEAVENAFSQLASVLEADKKALSIPKETHIQVLAASRLVGDYLNILVKEHPDFRKGGEQKDALRKIARASGFRTRKVVLTEDNWWKEDAGPLIATLTEGNEPVALLPLSATSYEMVNPADGSRVEVNAENQGRLTGLAYTFYRPLPRKKLTFRDIFSFAIKGLGYDFLMIVLLGIGVGLLGLITPIATGTIFNSLIPGAERAQLLQLMVAMVTAAFAIAAFSIARDTSIQRVTGKIDAALQAGVWDRLLDLPAPFFREYSAGDLAQRTLGINMISQVLSVTAVTAILGAVFGLFNVALLFYYSVKLALVGVLLVLLSLAFFYFFTRMQLKVQPPMVRLQGKISGMVLQFISNGIAKLRVAGAEDRAFAKWAESFTEQTKFTFKGGMISNWMAIFQSIYPLLCTFILFLFMSYWTFKTPSQAGAAIEPILSTGNFLAFNNAFSNFMVACLTMGTTLITVLVVIPIYQRIKPIFETIPEVDEAKTDPGELSGNIEVQDIYFRYKPDGPLVLEDVSFEAKEGEFIALVGPSGSGKSTLMRLLLGFEHPEQGSIYYDKQELFSLDLRAVRQQVGVVLQNGKLLAGDIFTNIVGSAPLTQADAWEALRRAGIEEDVKEMPMQLFSVISEGATTLSGGQRQRMMIARAIVHKPRIILFDEATSALDNRTQELVSKSLEELKATRIVIAHRLSTIQHADRIYVIVAGKVVQVGTFDELVKQPGPFQNLVKRQMA